MPRRALTVRLDGVPHPPKGRQAPPSPPEPVDPTQPPSAPKGRHAPARLKLSPPSADAVSACADAIAAMILRSVLNERIGDEKSLTFSRECALDDGEVIAAPAGASNTDGSLGKPRVCRGSP